MPYTPIATEVVRSLVWTNISWDNLSTSICNRSTVIIVDTPDRDNTRNPQIWFIEGDRGNRYVDQGAELETRVVNIGVFLRPNSEVLTNIRSHKRDKDHLIEEVTRVVRQNRANASGYEFMWIPNNGVLNMNIENDPSIRPPYLEALIRVNLRKIREELT